MLLYTLKKRGISRIKTIKKLDHFSVGALSESYVEFVKATINRHYLVFLLACRQNCCTKSEYNTEEYMMNILNCIQEKGTRKTLQRR